MRILDLRFQSWHLGWRSAAMILLRGPLACLLVVLSVARPARAGDERRTFCERTLKEWISVLRDESSPTVERENALVALGCFGKEARAATPDLVAMLRRREGPSNSIIDALVRMGEAPEVTVPALIERFLGQDRRFRPNSPLNDSFARVGAPAVPALVKVLEGPDKEMRAWAAEALGRIGPAAREAVPALLRAIDHPDEEEYADVLTDRAIQALGKIGPDASAAIPAMERLLQGKADHYDLVMALDGIGAPPIRKLLDDLVRDGELFVAQELASLGPRARGAIPGLRAALSDPRLQVRIAAAVALAGVDPTAAEAVPALIEALDHSDDKDLDTRYVAEALGRLGPRAKAAIPSLIRTLMEDMADDDYVDEPLVRSLVLLDPEGRECLLPLVTLLKAEHPASRSLAADCLGLLGPRAGAAVPELAETVTRDFDGGDLGNVDDPQVCAAKALRRISPRAKSAIPALIAALKYRHGEPDACSAAEAAADTLGAFGADAKDAIPALIEAVKLCEEDDPSGPVRKAAILALGRIGPNARAVVPVLREMLDDEEYASYHPEVIAALTRLAPDGKELAKQWLATSMKSMNMMNQPIGPWWNALGYGLEDRVRVLAALGETRVESEWITRRYLEYLDSMLRDPEPLDDPMESSEWWFEGVGRFGVGAWEALPRLNEYRQHPNPWVRMWAAEAIERITAPATE